MAVVVTVVVAAAAVVVVVLVVVPADYCGEAAHSGRIERWTMHHGRASRWRSTRLPAGLRETPPEKRQRAEKNAK
jgi:hypothetical protein